MKKRLFFLLSYYLLWVLFFVMFKGIFLLYHGSDTASLSLTTIAGIFGHGLRLDLSFSAYIAALPFLLISFSVFTPMGIIRPFIKIYTIIVAILVTFLCLIDLELYSAWGFRLDATPVMYLDTPAEMMASAGAAPIVLLLIIYLLTLLPFVYIHLKLSNTFLAQAPTVKLKFLPLFLILAGGLIIPIRGGLQLAPINISNAYFSEHIYANQAAINAPWNFFNALSRRTYDKSNPYQYMQDKVAEDIVKKHFSLNEETSFSMLNNEQPNVLLIIWESFTAKATQTLGNIEGITPNFDRLVREGALFSNFYATADRSDKGLVSILSGYPAQPTQSVIKLPKKSAKLPDLSLSFESKGYSTSFYYGGELEFANIKSYLYNAGFDRIIGKDDFDREDWNSKWGAHDHVVLNRVLEDLDNIEEPFFTTVFTLSSHEPFEVPIAPVIKGEDEESLFLNSLFYTDQAIGDFIEASKQKAWYKNTLVIILADHGHRLPLASKNHEKEKFHIPMLWLGGALAVPDTIIETYSSQADLAATLLHQTGIPSTAFTWSRDIFDQNYTPFAQYVFNDGFGHVSDNGYLAFDNISKNYIYRDTATSPYELEFSKAYLQLSFKDFLDK